MSIRILRDAQIADVDYQVRELTVGEIRAWVADVSAHDAVDVFLLEDALVSDIGRCTSLTPVQIDRLTPSECAEVLKLVREVNRDFFRLRSRLVGSLTSLAGS